MDEQTHPDSGVSQADPQARVEAFLNSQPEGPADEETQPSKPAQQQEQPEGPASDEPTAEDLPEEVEQPAVDAFEIVHDGTQVKLTREEAIKYARQGFDYTQKTQQLAEKAKQVDGHLKVLAEVNSVQPYLMQERAQVAAIEQQLAQYQNFNWVKLATEDPMGYPAARAQYDVLVNAHQHAMGQYQQRESAVKQHLAQVVVQRREAENARVPELIPEWKDPQKRQAGEQALAKHYESTYGIGFQELNAHLNGAISMAVAYKAMKYDQLVKSKGEKVKQLRTAPPATKPGASQSTTAQADQEAKARERLRKTGDRYAAAEVLFNRMK